MIGLVSMHKALPTTTLVDNLYILNASSCANFFSPLRSNSRRPDLRLSPVVHMRVHLQSSSVIMYAQIKCIYACVDGLNAGGVRCFAISARGCDISRGARAECQVVVVPERVLLIRLEDVAPTV